VQLEKEIQSIKVEILELQSEASRIEKGHEELTAIAKRQGIDSNETQMQVCHTMVLTFVQIDAAQNLP
jgi:cell shape-determining protein MreC